MKKPKPGEPTHCTYRVSAKAFIINDGKVLLLRGQADEWWNFPGGGIEHGENIAQALCRELAEELGIAPGEIRTDGQVVCTSFSAIAKNFNSQYPPNRQCP